MSLLLKALKQAELGDKPGAGRTVADGRQDPELELEPVAAAGAQAREWVEPPGLLFGSSGLSPAPGPARGFRWPQLSLVPTTALLAVLTALGYGAYLYFALQAPPSPLAPPATGATHDQPPPAAAPAPVPPPAADVQAEPPAAAPTARPAVQPVASPSASRKAAPQQAARLPVAPPSAGVPSLQPDAQSQLLTRAYAAYARGALDEAQRLYAQAASGRRNVDALLGLGAIASLQNRDADAQRLYRQVLELDPHNATAQGALLDLLGNTDNQATESRLKILIDRDPSPQLYQTLGNLYADQQRWSEAQSAYFEAYRGAPDSADYAFNLAVSLDQLRQYSAALTYYQKALAAEGTHRFDRSQAEARVQQLKSFR